MRRRLPPPYELQANPHSLLDLTDLVFIDPVSTGFSRRGEGGERRSVSRVMKKTCAASASSFTTT